MQDIRLVIFDMDGLMFDTEKIAFISWQEAAIKYGYEIGEQLFMRTVGVSIQGTREMLL